MKWPVAVVGVLIACVFGSSLQPEAALPVVDDVAFLAGAWQGTMGESLVEEHWSAPRGGNVIGMFRWLRPDGTPIVLEMLLISREGDKTVLRIRHFDRDLNPWASEAEPMRLELAEAGEGRAVFVAATGEEHLKRVTYRCPSPDELHIDVEFPAGSGQDALAFRLRRSTGVVKPRG